MEFEDLTKFALGIVVIAVFIVSGLLVLSNLSDTQSLHEIKTGFSQNATLAQANVLLTHGDYFNFLLYNWSMASPTISQNVTFNATPITLAHTNIIAITVYNWTASAKLLNAANYTIVLATGVFNSSADSEYVNTMAEVRYTYNLGATLLSKANYTLSSVGNGTDKASYVRFAANTNFNNTAVEMRYSYYYDSYATNSTKTNITSLADIPGWIQLLVIVVVIVLLLSIVLSIKRPGGE